MIGASPDGFIGSNGLVEINFPFTRKINFTSKRIKNEDMSSKRNKTIGIKCKVSYTKLGGMYVTLFVDNKGHPQFEY